LPEDDKALRELYRNLKKGAQQLNLSLQDAQFTLLVDFLLLMRKWNRVYNLTAVRSIDDMVGRHILDSLSVLPWLPETTNLFVSKPNSIAPLDVIDVGSGAGIPVLPLAIIRPDLQFLSVESNGKKTRFQQQAILELGLKNVRVCQERIEKAHDKAHTVISRAFTSPEKFILAVDKNCLPESRVIIMLGLKERLPTVLPLGYTILELVEIEVPQSDATRHVAICSSG